MSFVYETNSGDAVVHTRDEGIHKIAKESHMYRLVNNPEYEQTIDYWMISMEVCQYIYVYYLVNIVYNSYVTDTG